MKRGNHMGYLELDILGDVYDIEISNLRDEFKWTILSWLVH